MSGIYIHIPFCKQACHYCNFHFSTSLRYKNELINALLKEVEIYSLDPFPFKTQSLPAENKTGFGLVETIYMGGGTPSLLDTNEIRLILEKIHHSFDVARDAEITLEANPDDIDQIKLAGWKEAGINRLSIGVQSFFAEDLQWMNRAHDAVQAARSLELAVRQFANITIDLIYGTPDMTNAKWKENVDRAIGFGIPHLSCYALTVEPKTPLEKRIRHLQSKDVNPDVQSEQFTLLMEWMEQAGYEHYEISNFAKPGYRSRHNSSYWSGKTYIGLGPSAHSFDGDNRWWNVANNNLYIDSIQKSILPSEAEILTPTQKMNEAIMV
ncbi:MAG: radical SAM family heme chaperone HemW, partial [Chitinophagaceae bacterium]